MAALKTKTEKYLTDMKELPDFDEGNNSELAAYDKKISQPQATEKKQAVEDVQKKIKAVGNVKKNIVTVNKVNQEKISKDTPPATEVGSKPAEKKKSVSLKNYSTKDILLGGINLLAVIFLIILLTKLPAKAVEVKKLKNELLQSQTSTPINTKEIEASASKADEINDLFIDNSKVFEFASELDKLKVNSKIVEWAFAAQEPVKDKTGTRGLPVIITLRGESVDELMPELARIRELPYIFRPISIDVAPSKDLSEDGKSLIVFKYGVLLYINEKP